jgi:hypothetical protein
MSKPTLVNILRNTLLQVEEKIEASEDEPAVSELRKQIALTVAEVELIKDRRSAAAESEPRLFIVSRRRQQTANDNTTLPIDMYRGDSRSRRS